MWEENLGTQAGDCLIWGLLYTGFTVKYCNKTPINHVHLLSIISEVHWEKLGLKKSNKIDKKNRHRRIKTHHNIEKEI